MYQTVNKTVQFQTGLKFDLSLIFVFDAEIIYNKILIGCWVLVVKIQ